MKVYFFGDSITAGQLVSPHLIWTHSVSKYFHDEKSFFMFQQVATNGDTSQDALDKVHYQIIDQKPNVVFLQFGLNDANRWTTIDCQNRVSIELFKSNMKMIIERITRIPDVRIFVLTSHIIKKNHLCNKFPSLQQDIESYNQVLREISLNNEYDCQLIDFESISKNWQADYLLADGIHLSERGHELYAKVITEELRKQINVDTL